MPLNSASFCRTRTLRQGIAFVKLCSMTGSIFVIFYYERPFLAISKCESNSLGGKISHFSDRLLQISFAEHNGVLRNSRTRYCLRKFYSRTGYHFQEFDSGTGWLSDFQAAPPRMFVDQVTPSGGREACFPLEILLNILLMIQFFSIFYVHLDFRYKI